MYESISSLRSHQLHTPYICTKYMEREESRGEKVGFLRLPLSLSQRLLQDHLFDYYPSAPLHVPIHLRSSQPAHKSHATIPANKRCHPSIECGHRRERVLGPALEILPGHGETIIFVLVLLHARCQRRGDRGERAVEFRVYSRLTFPSGYPSVLL